jgi:hypothetical protein
MKPPGFLPVTPSHLSAQEQVRKQNQSHSAIQPKIATFPQKPKQPVAPPAYRPQPTPQVLQRKSAMQQPAHAAQVKPATPSVYRPQPLQKCLQAKITSGEQQFKGKAKQPSLSPPSRCFQPVPKALQAKTPAPLNRSHYTPVVPSARGPKPEPQRANSAPANTPQQGMRAQPSPTVFHSPQTIRPRHEATNPFKAGRGTIQNSSAVQAKFNSSTIQLRQVSGQLLNFSPEDAARTPNTTTAQASVNGVPLNSDNNTSVFKNSTHKHAEIKIIEAYNSLPATNQPRLLSIRINRMPCGPCATALANLLTTNQNLAIRIKASSITERGGLATLQSTPRLHLRYWTIADIEAKGLLVNNTAINDLQQFSWTRFCQWIDDQTNSLNKRQTLKAYVQQKLNEITNNNNVRTVRTAKRLIKAKLRNELPETSKSTINSYTNGIVKVYSTGPDEQDAKQVLNDQNVTGGWGGRNLTRAEILLGLQPPIIPNTTTADNNDDDSSSSGDKSPPRKRHKPNNASNSSNQTIITF